ncbi:hypothetical protein J0H58_20800 [bacterium]|nr:hypothetical protein [bacterium]
MNEAEPDFTGLVVKLLVDGPDKWHWWALQEPRFERQHGRVFLVGSLADPDPSRPSWWGRTAHACVAWDRVSFYYTESIPDRQQRKFGGPGCNTVPM